jgi:hypothetical protein
MTQEATFHRQRVYTHGGDSRVAYVHVEAIILFDFSISKHGNAAQGSAQVYKIEDGVHEAAMAALAEFDQGI